MRRLFQVLLVGLFVVAMCATVQAATIGQHVGSTDPTTEGFNQDANGIAPVGVNDGGTQAWLIDSLWCRNSIFPSAAQLTDMSTNGWVAQQKVRMGVANLDPNNTAYLGMATMEVAPSLAGTDAYSVCLGTDASGNPTVWQFDELVGGPSLVSLGTVTGTGYHTYQLVHAPGAATATLSVDGSYMATLNPTPGFGLERYMIGNTASQALPGTAVGVYLAGASLTTPVPEPTTLALLTIGLFGLLAYAWRKRR